MDQTRALQGPSLKGMVTFPDLERVLLQACRSPSSRIAVSHCVKWMSSLAEGWSDDELLIELLAVIVIAAELPTPETAMDVTFVSTWAEDVWTPQRGRGQIMP